MEILARTTNHEISSYRLIKYENTEKDMERSVVTAWRIILTCIYKLDHAFYMNEK